MCKGPGGRRELHVFSRNWISREAGSKRELDAGVRGNVAQLRFTRQEWDREGPLSPHLV